MIYRRAIKTQAFLGKQQIHRRERREHHVFDFYGMNKIKRLVINDNKGDVFRHISHSLMKHTVSNVRYFL